MKEIEVTTDWRNQNLPEPIIPFMEKWQAIANEEMKIYELEWTAKLVETRFIYQGSRYIITPATFDIPDDLCERLQIGPWVKKKHGGGLDSDLRKIEGVRSVSSFGFLD